MFGDEVTGVALPSVALLLLHATPFQFGLLTASAYLPYPVLGLVVGAWVDRIRRRRVLVLADATRFVAIASLPVAALVGVITVTQMFVVGLIVGTASVFFNSAYQAYLPSIVRADEITAANAKLSVSETSSQVGGPPLAGLLISAFGASGALLVDAGSFLVSIISLAFIRRPELDPRGEPPGGSRTPAGRPPGRSRLAGRPDGHGHTDGDGDGDGYRGGYGYGDGGGNRGGYGYGYRYRGGYGYDDGFGDGYDGRGYADRPLYWRLSGGRPGGPPVPERVDPDPPAGPERATGGGSLFADVVEGLKVVFGNRLLRGLTLTSALSNLGRGMALELFLLFAYNGLQVSPAVAGLMLAAGNVGSLLGSLTCRRLTDRLGLGRTLILGSVMKGLPWLLAPLTLLGGAVPIIVGIMIASSYFVPISNVTTLSLRQSMVSRELQGRVAATTRTVTRTIVPLSAVLGGILAQLGTASLGRQAGLAAVLALGGLLWTGATLLLPRDSLRRLRSLDDVDATTGTTSGTRNRRDRADTGHDGHPANDEPSLFEPARERSSPRRLRPHLDDDPHRDDDRDADQLRGGDHRRWDSGCRDDERGDDRHREGLDRGDAARTRLRRLVSRPAEVSHQAAGEPWHERGS
jgi:MFS family permease